MALPFESSPFRMHVQNGQIRVATKEDIESQRTYLSSMSIREDAQKTLENVWTIIKPQ